MRIVNKDNTAGVYHTNRFCITLPPITDIFDETGFKLGNLSVADNRDKFSSFIHEYYHYLHNLSTVSGFMSFLIFQELLAIFWKCLNSSGISEGQVNFTSTDEAFVTELLAEMKYYNGDTESPQHIDQDRIQSCKIVNLLETKNIRTIKGKDVEKETIIITFAIQYDTGNSVSFDYQFGDNAIDEGIAYEIDRFVAAATTPAGGSIIDDNAPQFPYLVLRYLSEYIVHSGMPIISRISCAKLALLTANPGKAFVSLLKDYENIKAAEPAIEEKVILDRLWKNIQTTAIQAIDTLLNIEIPSLEKMHESRGIIGPTMKKLMQMFRSLLTGRKDNPFFDLYPFMNNKCDLPMLEFLLNTIVPCSIIQERKGDDNSIERDILLSFTPKKEQEIEIDSDKYTLSNLFAPLNTQLCYLLSHITLSGFVQSNPDDENKCPFYTCCNLPHRKANQEVCKREPWKAYIDNGNNCWYGTAVASTLGNVKVTKIIKGS